MEIEDWELKSKLILHVIETYLLIRADIEINLC